MMYIYCHNRPDPVDGFPPDACDEYEAWEDRLQEGVDEANRELSEVSE